MITANAILNVRHIRLTLDCSMKVQIMFHRLSKLYAMTHQLFQWNVQQSNVSDARKEECAHVGLAWLVKTHLLQVKRLSVSNMKSIRTVTRLCATDTYIQSTMDHHLGFTINSNNSLFLSLHHISSLFSCLHVVLSVSFLLFGILFIVDVNILKQDHLSECHTWALNCVHRNSEHTQKSKCKTNDARIDWNWFKPDKKLCVFKCNVRWARRNALLCWLCVGLCIP